MEIWLKELLEKCKWKFIWDVYEKANDIIDIEIDEDMDLIQISVPEWAEIEIWESNFELLEEEFKKIKWLESLYQEDRELFNVELDESDFWIDFYIENKNILEEKMSKIYLNFLINKS